MHKCPSLGFTQLIPPEGSHVTELANWSNMLWGNTYSIGTVQIFCSLKKSINHLFPEFVSSHT